MLTVFETYWHNELFRLAVVSALVALGGALYWVERLVSGAADTGIGVIVVTGSIG